MKEEYILYLDESELVWTKTFSIAGFAIKKSDVNIVEKGIREAKQILWDDNYIDNENPVLHCTELNRLFRYRNDDELKQVKEEYEVLVHQDAKEIEKKYNQIYGKLTQTLKKCHGTVFGCVIDIRKLQQLYLIDENHNGIYLIDDKYNIALQRIVENYTHFLTMNDGYGNIVYESRNSSDVNSFKSPDVKLVNNYHKIVSNNKGIVYTDPIAIQKRNRNIVTYSKQDMVAGLELADFIAHNICYIISDKKRSDFLRHVHQLSYNGGRDVSDVDQRYHWGIKIIPSGKSIDELESENRKLKNAYQQIKKDRNRLNKKLEQLERKNVDNA